MKQRLASLLAMAGLAAGLTFAGAGVPAASAATSPDSLGTDFWLAFPGNLGSPTLTLFLTGPTATTGTVAAPGAGFSAPFTVTPGTVTSVTVPSSLAIDTSDTVESLGIHVTSTAEVTVYGLNRITFTTDAYLGLPTDILGTEYIVQGYKNTDIVNGTQFAVVATQDATTVTINPTVTTDGHTAGTPYTVNLNQGQTYQLRNGDLAPADLSGSIVTSNLPVAVFGGHECANIPAGAVACDHIVEEMTPTATWGKSFVTEPLATRTGGDTFRFLADTAGTTVMVNGAIVATLNRGQLFEQILTAASVITSDKPILVTQYSNSSSFDGVTSDPFEVIVPPSEQFLNSYTVTTPATDFDANFINVVAPTASLATIKLDGVTVPIGSFAAIPGSTFSGAQLPVALGSHTIEGADPFGVTVYGFAQFDSYGYPGGLSLAPVATVTTVTLAPKDATNPINTEHCVTATVTDQNGNPVVGVRVDFVVTGVNPTSGFAPTVADGTAEFCYTGTNTGIDTITATVGTLSDTATKTWTTGTPGTPTLTTTATAGPVVVGAPIIDTAHLGGGVGTLTGSISFQVYAPGDTTCATPLSPQPAGATVNGAGDYPSGPFTTADIGTYRWRAFFTDTDGNNTDVSTACNDPDESSAVTQNPGIAITKLPATQTIASGGTATWAIVVRNTGDVPLTGVNVTDPNAPDCVKTFAGPLGPGDSEPGYTCTLANITANMTNTATAHGTPPVGGEVTGHASADVVVVQPETIGLIAHSNTSCTQYVAGKTPPLPRINYRVSRGKIAQGLTPGNFVYFSTVAVTANQTVTTSQSTTNSSGALFRLNRGHAFVFDSDCKKVGKMASTDDGATASFTFKAAGTYVLKLQYTTKSIAHTTAPNPKNPSYTFDTAIDGVEFIPDTASIGLVKK
jgi:hypothetical protein